MSELDRTRGAAVNLNWEHQPSGNPLVGRSTLCSAGTGGIQSALRDVIDMLDDDEGLILVALLVYPSTETDADFNVEAIFTEDMHQ